MSHDTHDHHDHETAHDHNKERKVSTVSFKSSFWMVIIIVGLFIAALNFISAESGGEEKGKEKTEMKAGGAEVKSEKAEMKAEEPKPAEAAATKDTAAQSEK